MRLANLSATGGRAVLWSVIGALSLVLGGASPALGGSLSTLNFDDTHQVGSVVPGVPTADTDQLVYVNHLLGMTLGSSQSADGQSYTRSGNDFGHLANALLDGRQSGTGTSIDLGAGGVFSYLFAKYDGSSDGAWVWYVGDLTGFQSMPAFHGPYGIAGWTLFAPDPIAPDGRIRRNGGPLQGDGVYNNDAAGQTVMLRMYAGDHRKAFITIQNDGDESGTFTVAADAGSATGFHVAYHIGSSATDATSAVEAGTFTTPTLAPGAVYRLRVNVGVTTATPRGSSIERLVTITANADGTTTDAVGFVVKRK